MLSNQQILKKLASLDGGNVAYFNLNADDYKTYVDYADKATPTFQVGANTFRGKPVLKAEKTEAML